MDEVDTIDAGLASNRRGDVKAVFEILTGQQLMSETSESRTYSFKLAWCFTAALMAIDLLLICFIPNSPSKELAVIGFVGVNLAFAGIVAIWASVLKGWIPYVPAFFVLILTGVALAANTGGAELQVILIPLAIGLVVGLTLETVKLLRGNFVTVQASDVEFEEGMQFSILQLMLLTAGVAVFCSVIRLVWPMLNFSSGNGNQILTLGVLVATISVNTLASIWAMLGQKVGFRLPVMIMCQVVASMAGYFYFSHLSKFEWGLLVGLSIAATIVHLFLLRRGGLRFVRKRSLQAEL
ncbi:hypothetical protein MFFC18_40920 [Mariniblastus fucicola]|uniref:Uncharacterized protein n=1 Tax=Mariniblastus fucicola TaxID=980251 RepID=A0A5B9PG36_9BACT|nr:hypothetical protein MFFC18_40920 [Mariniblastus fucicola]